MEYEFQASYLSYCDNQECARNEVANGKSRGGIEKDEESEEDE